MKTTLVAGVLALASASAVAGDADHFEPETSMWAGANHPRDDAAIYSTVFADAFAPDVRVRMLSSGGSPGPHYDDVVALKGDEAGYRIVAMHTDVVIALYTNWARYSFGDPDNPRDYRDIRPQQCEFAISPAAAWAIMETSQKVLLDVRYSDAPYMTDHYSWYQFWMMRPNGRQGELAGRIANPSADSIPSLVVDIAGALEEYCMRRSSGAIANLGPAIAALITKLNAQH